jgi:8-oxo-dGTP pyrophosphatase MutT (NUDIX family)
MFFYQPHCTTGEQEVSIVFVRLYTRLKERDLCYNRIMNLRDSSQVITALRHRLEPVERSKALIDIIEGARPAARKAAVLLGLFEQNEETYLAFIRRSTSLRSHSGEIAFPGGSVDPTDTSLAMTALREAQEEIGLNPARAEVLGILPPVFTVVSNFLVTPVVAYLAQGPGTLQLQPAEVDEVILLPLQGLANPAILHTEEWERAGLRRTVYFYDYGPYRIWGATARILHELLHLLQA